MKIEIDKFELLNWMNGCAVGSHLRQGIWQRAVDEFYDKLTEGERLCVYMYAKRDLTDFFVPKRLKNGDTYHPFGHEYFFQFLACYNPSNRYKVHMKGVVDGKKHDEWVNAYWWNNRYYTKFNRYCAQEYIVETIVDDKYEKCGLPCIWHDKCARYNERAGRIGIYANSKCDWFINIDTPHGADLEHFR